VFDQRMATLGYGTDGSDTSTPAMVGTTAAQAVLEFRHADGSNQLNGYADPCEPACYQPVNTWDQILDADRWQPLCVPTPPPGATSCAGVVQRFLTPHWRNVTPFALTSAGQFRSPGPAISLTADGKPNGKYQDEVDKITQHSKQLDDTRKIMAEYWADGPRSEFPPGHWNLFAQYVSRRDANTLDKDARLYFALNNAPLDASITAWDGKRNWDSVRPITAVRWLMRGKTIQAWGGPYKGPSYIKGEEWIPYQPPNDPTPPFAEYTSGHSTFSMAGAEVLTAFTGRGNFEMTVTIPAGRSRVEPRTATQPGVPAKPITLKWPTSGTRPSRPASPASTAGSTSRTATTTLGRPAPPWASTPGPRPSPTSMAPPPKAGGRPAWQERLSAPCPVCPRPTGLAAERRQLVDHRDVYGITDFE
jgi:hypothetical protein